MNTRRIGVFVNSAATTSQPLPSSFTSKSAAVRSVIGAPSFCVTDTYTVRFCGACGAVAPAWTADCARGSDKQPRSAGMRIVRIVTLFLGLANRRGLVRDYCRPGTPVKTVISDCYLRLLS